MSKQRMKWNRNTYDRKQGIRILITTFVAIISIVLFVSYMIKSVDETVTQHCFDSLTGAADGLIEDFQRSSQEDMTVLSALANVLTSEENLNDEKITMILNCYDISASYISYIELLKPDHTMLDADGKLRDVSGKIDFEEQAKRGKIVSNIEISTKDGSSKILRNVIPVVKDGKTIYIIYGTISLEDFASRYKVDAFEGQAYMFVEDGDTGDFILDTWHKSLGNISAFTDREVLPGYSWEKTLSDMQQGKSGRLSIVSTVTKKPVYLCYKPVGINNWNVMVMAPQTVALAESQTIRNKLYFMAVIVGIIIIGYMIYVTNNLMRSYKQIKKIGLEDKNTGLLNRNAYDKYMIDCQKRVFTNINCIYIDVNGLHQINNQYGHLAGDNMLRIVAQALKSSFEESFIYRIGGDEFVVFDQIEKKTDVETKMENLVQQIAEHDYSISYGIVNYENETGLERITRQADELMLEHKSAFYLKHDRRRHEIPLMVIVDDSEIDRAAIAVHFDENYQIKQFDKGMDAYKFIEENAETISIVLLDVMMPEISGIDLLKKIRGNKKTKRIPVIVASSDGMSEEDALSYGANDMVTKPIIPEVLKLRVKNACRG